MAVTVTKGIVILVLWAGLIAVLGYLTTTGKVAKALTHKNIDAALTSDRDGDPESGNDAVAQESGNWFENDPRANIGILLPIPSKRIAHPAPQEGNGKREQRWIASPTGIKSSLGGNSNGNSNRNNDNDNNAIKVSGSLLLNGPSRPRSHSHSHIVPTPTDPDPDPIATQVHEPIILSQDEKYQIINGVEEDLEDTNVGIAEASSKREADDEDVDLEQELETESNILRNRFLHDSDQRQKQKQWLLLKQKQNQNLGKSEADGESEEDDDNEMEQPLLRLRASEPHSRNSKLVLDVGVNENDDNNDETLTVQCNSKQLELYLASLVRHVQKQEKRNQHIKQLLLKQTKRMDDFMAQFNTAAKGLATESMRITDMESSIHQQLNSMNEKLEASVAKMDSAAMASQISLQLSKESFHQMDRIQETADDVLAQVRALKTELGDVGQASVQAIYNIQRSEENLMKQLGESWNRTIYALRQEPVVAVPAAAAAVVSAAASSSSSPSNVFEGEQTQTHVVREHTVGLDVDQDQQQSSSSSSAPSPTFFVQEKFIQADDAAPRTVSVSSINRNDDDDGPRRIILLPTNVQDERRDAETQESERNDEVTAANNNSQLSPNRTKGLVSRISGSDRNVQIQEKARGSRNVGGGVRGTHVSCSSRKKLINPQKPRDCSELQLAGYTQSGLYNIYPFGASAEEFVEVYCDLSATPTEGGWTVIQRRGDYQVSRENFQRSWQEYEKGFGSSYNHFWIGLAALSSLTVGGEQVLRIELTDWDGVKRNANYGYFRVGNATDFYRLHVTDFTGNAGDSLAYHNGMPFSTMDVDNDMDTNTNCAQRYRGGWWYRNCHQANLNGLYLEAGNGKTDAYGIGVNWYTWHGYYYSLKHVEMKIRSRDFGLELGA